MFLPAHAIGICLTQTKGALDTDTQWWCYLPLGLQPCQCGNRKETWVCNSPNQRYCKGGAIDNLTSHTSSTTSLATKLLLLIILSSTAYYHRFCSLLMMHSFNRKRTTINLLTTCNFKFNQPQRLTLLPTTSVMAGSRCHDSSNILGGCKGTYEVAALNLLISVAKH